MNELPLWKRKFEEAWASHPLMRKVAGLVNKNAIYAGQAGFMEFDKKRMENEAGKIGGNVVVGRMLLKGNVTVDERLAEAAFEGGTEESYKFPKLAEIYLSHEKTADPITTEGAKKFLYGLVESIGGEKKHVDTYLNHMRFAFKAGHSILPPDVQGHGLR